MKERLCLLVLFLFSTQSLSTFPPPTLNIGLFVEKFTKSGDVNVAGTHAFAAMHMAIREINNKTDGIYDGLLPFTKLQFAVRETYGDYLKASLDAQDFALKAFNGKGVVGAIGTGYDSSSKAMGQTFANTDFKVSNIDYFANDSELSHSASYPYFARVVPSRGFGGRVLAKVMKLYYGWDTATVFSTSDTYGTDSSSEFILEANSLGITIENKYSFWPGSRDFTEIIQGTKSHGILKIFVFCMKSEDAGALLEAGYNAGLFTVGTQILGTQFIVKPPAWQSMSAGAPVKQIMKGVLSVVPVQQRNHTEFTSFLNRFLSQPSTKTYRDDGSVVCNRDKDDDGNTYLHVKDATSLDCAGVDFSSLSPSGTDLEDMVAFAYDAVYAMALALHNVVYIQKIQNFTGDDIAHTIIDKVTFTGATGYIDFFEGLGGAEGYGKGDRQAGLKYEILNFNPLLYHKNSANPTQTIRRVGYWDVDKKHYIPCDEFNDDLCTEAVYNTHDGLLVNDTPTIIEVQLDEWARNLLRVGGAMALATVALYSFIWMLYGDTRLIKTTQPTIMYIVLLGGACGGIQIFLLSMDITDSTCMAGMWLGHLAFALVFAALLARTWRISKIINSGLTKISISARQMYTVIFGGLLLFCSILAIDTAIGRPHRSYKQNFDGHNNVRLIKCQNDNPNVTNALFGIEGLVLFYGAKLCWDTKDAPGSVNDSASISLALYLILFVCAVTFPIVFLSIDPTPQNLMLVMGLGYIVAVLGVLHIIFGSRAVIVVEGGEVDANLNIVKIARPKSITERAKRASQSLVRKVQSRAGIRSSMGSSSDGVQVIAERTIPVAKNVEQAPSGINTPTYRAQAIGEDFNSGRRKMDSSFHRSNMSPNHRAAEPIVEDLSLMSTHEEKESRRGDEK